MCDEGFEPARRSIWLCHPSWSTHDSLVARLKLSPDVLLSSLRYAFLLMTFLTSTSELSFPHRSLLLRILSLLPNATAWW